MAYQPVGQHAPQAYNYNSFSPRSSYDTAASHPRAMQHTDSERALMGSATPQKEGYVAHEPHSVPRARRSKKWWWVGGILAALVVIGAVLGGVLGTQLNKNKDNSKSASGGADKPGSAGKAENGADGSTVNTDNGSFIYVNKLGGSWAVDPANPYNTSGQAQEGVPRLTEKWTWGKDPIRGVNLGGWLVTEPFIVPSLYEAYQNSTPQAVDEYTLSQAMGSDLAAKMEEHYRTFITEQDFAEIAQAGLNWVRVPIGFWALETWDDEPYLERVSWKYFLKAIEWARKYGLRLVMDLHALPGSQNGWNHSGRGDGVSWMYGVMGLVNAERSLEILRSLVQFVSQPGIKEVIPVLSLVNELPNVPAMNPHLTQDAAGTFYLKAYDMIREITGTGEGNGPVLAFHDGFLPMSDWQGFLMGADRLALDQHQYLAFGEGNQTPRSGVSHAQSACSWGRATNDTQRDFGIVLGGEWSLAMSDCGKWLNGVQNTNSYDKINAATGGCKPLDEYMKWDQEFKDGLKEYMMASMDALQNWFFWTWKIGNSTEFGYPTSPMWHYRLGWKEGWIPEDPRTAGGFCRAKGYCQDCQEFNLEYPASATGGVASPTIAPDQVQKYGTWPPTSMGPINGTQMAFLPTLTQTGTPLTLPNPTPAPSGANGWAFPNDNKPAFVTVSGCSYLDPYNTGGAGVPTAACTGA